MSRNDPPTIRLHEDIALFREAITFTAAHTGFAARLIEKDYFCTLVLANLMPAAAGQVVFKGGTYLAKVLVGFYRLSEDLDFAIPLPVQASRPQRSKAAETMKKAVGIVTEGLPGVRLLKPLRGANNSTQYIGAIGYDSPTTGQTEAIQVEVSLREPLLMPVLEGSARTILLDPITEAAMVPQVALPCISGAEAIAEKFRAALTRRDAAIRDFYDIDHAVRTLGVNFRDAHLTGLIRQKLAVPGNDQVDVSPSRQRELRRQLLTRLRPVLRQQDFDAFDLDRAFQMVVAMAKALA
ncbi:MAG: hypothetical protein BWX88_01828 [Planctomycetes bacterium ADurb.Bin126]|nr:MAG: hypothetical protein BWX88_01828 [Planctomycetes bacterium ADurb.Bin126]